MSEWKRKVYIASLVWWVSFLSIAVLLMIAAAVGMAFMPEARPTPTEYPDRFLVLAMAAMAVALPGWMVSGVATVNGWGERPGDH